MRMTDAPDNEAVLEYAAREAGTASAHATRRATGGSSGDSGRRNLSDRVQDWHQCPDGVCIHHSHGYCRFLADHDERVQLAMIGGGSRSASTGRAIRTSGVPSRRECSVRVGEPKSSDSRTTMTGVAPASGFAYRPTSIPACTAAGCRPTGWASSGALDPSWRAG